MYEFEFHHQLALFPSQQIVLRCDVILFSQKHEAVAGMSNTA